MGTCVSVPYLPEQLGSIVVRVTLMLEGQRPSTSLRKLDTNAQWQCGTDQ
jgi:hypothetical protein